MIFLAAYQLLFPLVALAALAGVAKAGRWGAFKEGLADLSERLGRPAWTGSGPVLWVHAASVGETQALERLLARWKGLPVVVTCSTAAGREKAKTLPGVAAAYLVPADFFLCVSAFLDRLQPAALIAAESELWPMSLVAAQRRGIPIGLVNACLSERSARRWLLARPLAALALGGVHRACYQTEEDRVRFEALGVPVEAGAVTGNTKYDLRPPAPDDISAALERVRALFKDSPCWVAGSTRPGEEELVLAAHRKAAVPGLKLILAPRHPERSAEVAELVRKAGLPFTRWSELLPFAEEPQCLLVDVMGVLGPLYAAGQAAFVGGTLLPGSGGHNVLEPAMLGVPVLFGPHLDAVKAEAATLEKGRGCLRVSDADSLARGLESLLGDPERLRNMGRNAKNAADGFAGATERAADWLLPLSKDLGSA
ncbi:MAG: 3-deoxy-D-manno-octulosonic acid transferase [Elusimicrobia bacterium]|nr:3-deoxy-D-manno-octulosonic acid transferase [Elusimicrobiota bacterium]